MEKIKHLVFQHQDKLKYGLLIAAGVASINCLARPDYNIIIYIYIYYIWNILESKEIQTNEKVTSLLMLVYTLLLDFIWVFYWGSVWSSLKNDFESSIHGIVKIFSWIGILIKILLIFSIGTIEWSNLKSSLPKVLLDKLNHQSSYVEHKDEDHKDESQRA